MIAVVKSSGFASATVTKSLTPSKLSARPKRPPVERVAPLIVPVWPRPDPSATVVPEASSKPYAATRPAGTVDGGVTVSVTATVRVVDAPVTVIVAA